jgi:hypothetical protein
MSRYVITITGPRIATRKVGVCLADDTAATEHARGALADAPQDLGALTASVYRNRGCRGLVLIDTIKRAVAT